MTSPSDRLSLLGRSALRYAQAGWAVFPLTPRNKTPLLRGNWQTLATTDEDTIRDWWTQNPTANIALPTGRSFDVIDLDGRQGVESLYEIAPSNTYFHDGPVVLTGFGYHCYVLPSGSGNKASFLPKVDYRGMGGYVAAPPSVHPSGATYRWDNDHHRGLGCPLPPVPTFLAGYLTSEERSYQPPTLIVKASPTTPAKDMPKNGQYELSEIDPQFLPAGLAMRQNRPDIIQTALKMGLRLRKHTNYYVTRCIFGTHTDTTPSLTLYTHDNTFYCFGCRAYGDSHDLPKKNYITR